MARLHLPFRGRIRSGGKNCGAGWRNRLTAAGKSGYGSRTNPDFPSVTSRFRLPASKSTFRLRGFARESASLDTSLKKRGALRRPANFLSKLTIAEAVLPSQIISRIFNGITRTKICVNREFS